MVRLARVLGGLALGLLQMSCGASVPEGGAILQPAQVQRWQQTQLDAKRCNERAAIDKKRLHDHTERLKVTQARVALLEARLGLGPFH
ncbi:MAG TPA: hypothetical protein DCQ06_08390, partial [Myxococcales bacterium]|nr:hypothetical protein [Myxococcales bacterium]